MEAIIDSIMLETKLNGFFRKTKVQIQQPSIPIYRRPFFEQLNKKVMLELDYGSDGVPSSMPKDIEMQYYPLRVFNFGIFEIKWHLAQVKAILRKSDIAILSWDVQYLTLWIALIIKLITRKPLILWGHGYSKNEAWGKKVIRNIPLLLCDAAILYDYHTAQKLKENKRIREKVFVAPNSLDQMAISSAAEKWRSEVDRLEDFKSQYNIKHTFNLVYIGRIYPANQLELLFEATKLCCESIRDLRLIIIGKENGYSDSLKEQAERLGILENIIWAGEIYDEEKIAPWMLSSNVLCYPANIGLSIMHAFGYGLPVITDNNYSSHNPEIWAFSNGFNGLSYSQGDVNDFCNQIIRLFNDPELRLSLSENAKRTVTKTFTIEKMVDGFLEAIIYIKSK